MATGGASPAPSSSSTTASEDMSDSGGGSHALVSPSTTSNSVRSIAAILNKTQEAPTKVKLHPTNHKVIATKYVSTPLGRPSDLAALPPLAKLTKRFLRIGLAGYLHGLTRSQMVHFTGIWKALGHSKADVVRLIESQPEVAPSIRKVRGGYLKIQGTWLPFEIAHSLAKRVAWDLRHDLVPLFGPDFPDSCLAPGDPGFGQLLLSSPSMRRQTKSVDARAEARAEAQAAAALALNNKSVSAADQANMAKPILAKLSKVATPGSTSSPSSAVSASSSATSSMRFGGREREREDSESGRRRSPLESKSNRRISGNPYEAAGYYNTAIHVASYADSTTLRRSVSAGAIYTPYPVPAPTSSSRYSPYGPYAPGTFPSSYPPRQSVRHPTAALNNDDMRSDYLSPHHHQYPRPCPISTAPAPPPPPPHPSRNFDNYSSPFTAIGEKLSAVRDEKNPRLQVYTPYLFDQLSSNIRSSTRPPTQPGVTAHPPILPSVLSNGSGGSGEMAPPAFESVWRPTPIELAPLQFKNEGRSLSAPNTTTQEGHLDHLVAGGKVTSAPLDHPIPSTATSSSSSTGARRYSPPYYRLALPNPNSSNMDHLGTTQILHPNPQYAPQPSPLLAETDFGQVDVEVRMQE